MDKWKEETYYFLESQIKHTLAFISADCVEMSFETLKSLNELIKLMVKTQKALKDSECKGR